jgi:NADP-dependent 3-hydroxy acid dehydrogenase YdfG
VSATGSPAGRGVAVVTGASGGIGAATARVLASLGYETVLGARRLGLVESLASELSPPGRALPLDVTDSESVEEFCSRVPECRLLVNNAGGALGLEPVASADEEKWRIMYDTNVLGTLRMTKGLLPRLVESGDGLVVNVGSVAGLEPYPGGAGYNGVKAALSSLTDVLRMELLGQPVRVTEIDPGMVETDFSLVRFGGDAVRAAAVYAGLTPLTADDVAECIGFVASRPSHVDVDRLVLRPRDQARAHLLNRKS